MNMDLRIVNICNNNCLFCLERNHRENNQNYIVKKELFQKIKRSNDNRITFYGGNPLLHNDLIDIIKYCKLNNFKNINILSNTDGLSKDFLDNLKLYGLTGFGFYFNSFDKKNHLIVNGNGIGYGELLKNIKLLVQSGLILKTIININNLNIKTIYRDIYILYNKFGILDFDLVNYFPFDYAYNNKDKLEYSFLINRDSIDKLFKMIKRININVRFVKFSKDFFGKFQEYYNYDIGILDQIGEEDIDRLKGDEIPFCFHEKRCKNCYLKDNCKFYERI